MQIVPEKYFVSASDRLKTLDGIFIFIDIRKNDAIIERNFNVAMMYWVLRGQLAIFFDFVDNVVKVITDILGSKSGWLLENLNGVLSAHWGLILKTTGLNVVRFLLPHFL